MQGRLSHPRGRPLSVGDWKPARAIVDAYGRLALDELLDEALLPFVREEAERLYAIAGQLEGQPVAPAEVARLLVAELRAGQSNDDIAQLELYLEASRRPSLREVAAPVRGGCRDRLAGAGSPRAKEGARVFVALTDGLGLHRIASGADQDVEDALLTLFIPFAMDEAELRSWRNRLSPPAPPRRGRSARGRASS